MPTTTAKDKKPVSINGIGTGQTIGGNMRTPTLKEKTPAARKLDVRPALKFDAFDDVMAFAIEDKTRTHDLYARFGERARHPWARKAFEELAAEMLNQRGRLEEARREGALRVVPRNVPNLKISDYVTADVVPDEEVDTREAMIFAIRVERDTLRLYTDLADQAGDTEIQSLFLTFAQEQAQHLRNLETEYEDHVFAQN